MRVTLAIAGWRTAGRIAKRVGLEPAAVMVERPPVWLIGGYELYYPSCFFDRLVSEIRAGLLSAYSETFDSVRIFADTHRPFISIEFRCSSLAMRPLICLRSLEERSLFALFMLPARLLIRWLPYN